MTGYENYSPEIPLGDDTGIDGLPESPSTEESSPAEKGRGERRSKKERNQKAGQPKSKEKKGKAVRDAKKETVKTAKEISQGVGEVASAVKGFMTSQNLMLILGLILGGLGVWLLIAFLSYFADCVSDQAIVNHSPVGQAQGVANAAGEGGARLTELLINEGFGLGSAVLIVWVIAMSSKLLVGWPRFKSVDFTIKCFVALITLSLIVGLVTLATSSPVNWGGYHGRYVNEFIVQFIGWPGAVVLSLVMIGIFVIICLRDLVNWLLRLKRARDARRAAEEAERAEKERIEREIQEMREREEKEAIGPVPPEPAPLTPDMPLEFQETDNTPYAFPDFDDETFTYRLDERDPDETVNVANPGIPPVDASPAVVAGSDSLEEPEDEVGPQTGSVSPLPPSSPATSASTEVPVTPTAYGATSGASGPAVTPQGTPTVTPQGTPTVTQTGQQGRSMDPADESSEDGTEKAEDGQEMVINVNQVATVDKVPRGVNHSLYQFPPVELLRPGVEKISVDADEQMANKEKIRKTLADFDIPIVSIEATVGPTVTLYEIRPERGVKIAKIRNLVDDLALSLSAIGVRIIAPIPGKGTVGIEVANKDPLTVSMQTIIKSKRYQETDKKLPTAIGLTISNDVYIADLAKMPHLLVAGATGQGKSVGLNAIIASLLYSRAPHELKFVMIDPKMVEFSLYALIEKHYLAKIPDAEDAIITDMSKVVATLNSLCVEMDDRYLLLKAAQVRNLEEYNSKIARGQLSAAEGHKFLPYIVVVVDEFADLMVTAGKEVETPIARLAQKARAVGMHVIIATQRPSANVITGVIKANFPARIAFRVSSGIDSKTILDTTGAQQLIGRGDMLISNNSEMVRVQCAFIDTPEVQAICEHIASQPGFDGPYILPEPPIEGGGSGADGENAFFGERDPLLEEVGRWIVQSNVASTSGLQRRYSIGYNRAGKIMDQLEALGVVGPSTGGKPRDVLVDVQGIEMIFNSL